MPPSNARSKAFPPKTRTLPRSKPQTRVRTAHLRSLIIEALQARAPDRMSVSDVISDLRRHGIDPEADRKRIERALRFSHEWTAIQIFSEGAAKKLRYWIARDESRIPEREGVTLALAWRELLPVLPPTSQRELKARKPSIDAQFNRQKKVSPVARWLDYVRIVPRIHPQTPPAIQDDVLATVHEAILADRMLRITYHSTRTEGRHRDISTYDISVLGLVHQSPVFVLVALIQDEQAIWPHNLDRVLAAEILDARAQRPAGFDLDRYIQAGNLHHRLSDETLLLRVRASPRISRVWKEQKLSADQKVIAEHRGCTTFCASVPDTFTLRAYLLGFGDEITILGPPKLIAHFRAVARAILAAHPESPRNSRGE